MGQQAREKKQQQKKQTDSAMTGHGRTSEVTAQWNQMTALRFRTGEDVRPLRPPFREKTKCYLPTWWETCIKDEVTQLASQEASLPVLNVIHPRCKHEVSTNSL